MKKNIRTGIILFLIDIIVVTLSFLSVIFITKSKEILYIKLYIKPFLGFLFIWIVTSIFNAKYKSKQYLNEAIIAIGKTLVYSLLIVVSSMYIFNRFEYSRTIVFGTVFLSSLANLLIYILYLINKKYKKYTDEGDESESTEFPLESIVEPLKTEGFTFPDIPFEDSISTNLKLKYLAQQPTLFEFLEKNIPLSKIPRKDALIINSANIFNIQNYESNSQLFFLNLRRINDLRRFNVYFIQVNENLNYGGFYVGTCETNEIRRQNIIRKYPYIFAGFINFIDFFFHRVSSKLPLIKGIYFYITKGSNRPVSKSEVLGRLKYCGFYIVDNLIIDNQFFFIVKKVTEPRSDLHPSYGPFIKLKRIGKGRKIIEVYKFRTMHPYSEFIQEYVFKNNKLEEGGKLKNDFRVTEWGKVFRKLWIDELPQFINFFKGEVKLVGVRALSEHYFSLYPKDIQELRTKTKPGLIPPFYADMPKTFDEILDSERKYLNRYFRNPFLTDIRYFFLVFYNIIFKKARSR
ncbi:MAG: sugar transferase [Bacteroidota bacterium]